MKPYGLSRSRGFTLTEMLIVVAIMVILLLVALINLRAQVGRAQDSKRKQDLADMRTAFEAYYNDNLCYPSDPQYFNACGSPSLTPWGVKKVPCDPLTKQPYFVGWGPTGACSGFALCAKLVDKTDPDIIRMGCDPIIGCSVSGQGYNYCLVSGIALTPNYSGGGGGGTPTPTTAGAPWPTQGPGENYACVRTTDGMGNIIGVCNSVGNPTSEVCPKYYVVDTCLNECGNSANWCN